MFTPQQIEQITFGTSTFGGYDKRSVDEFLEPLVDDYVTLYKENALLKSKMRVLVGKLEEYRSNEASMRDAIVNAQKTCDTMVRDAESKCAQMLNDANAAAAASARSNDALIAAENARVEEARKLASRRIEQLEAQLRACIEALEQIRQENRPANPPAAPVAGGEEDLVGEISQSLESLVGTTEDTAPKAEPCHPVSDTSSKFANLRFGRNYDPTHPAE